MTHGTFLYFVTSLLKMVVSGQLQLLSSISSQTGDSSPDGNTGHINKFRARESEYEGFDPYAQVFFEPIEQGCRGGGLFGNEELNTVVSERACTYYDSSMHTL